MGSLPIAARTYPAYFVKARTLRSSACASVILRPGVTLISPDAVVIPQPMVQTPTLSL